MNPFSFITDILALPLGYLLYGIYYVVKNYFVAMFLFTLVVRAATFPFSMKSQKANADKARLAPRLERIQKKYKGDPKKLQEMQMKLYEKEGVSMMGGCLPMIIPMIVLFGVIGVIYNPLKFLARMPDDVISAASQGIIYNVEDDEKDDTTGTTDAQQQEDKHEFKIPSDSKELNGYYKELALLKHMDRGTNRADIEAEINKLSDDKRKGITAQTYLAKMDSIKDDFQFFGGTLLATPNENGYTKPSILWLIPLISGLTAVGSSLISMYFMKKGQSGEQQPGQGCSNALMLVIMPMFSLYITFTVPGGVGVYWICSNIIAVIQTMVMNLIYNPAKVRAEAYAEDAMRRQRRLEDKKRLAEARKQEEEEARLEALEEKKRVDEKIKQGQKVKPVKTSTNPNKQKRREQDENDENPESSAENGNDITERN